MSVTMPNFFILKVKHVYQIYDNYRIFKIKYNITNVENFKHYQNL